MPLHENSSLATALKELPSFKGDGSLAFVNPYYSATAPATSTLSIAQVERAVGRVLDCAGLNVQRARLFFMEEPATPTHPDILLVVVYVALGRIWRREKTLLDVHNSFRELIESTKYRRLPDDEADTLLDVEEITCRKGKYSDDDFAGIASTIDCVLQCFDWNDYDILKFARNVKSKSKGAGFKYQQLKQVLGRAVSLRIGRTSVLADITDDGSRDNASSRPTIVTNTFKQVREWLEAGSIRFEYDESSGSWAVVPFTAVEAYEPDALPVKGPLVQPDTHARYEKVLARALGDVAPTCGTLQDQASVLQGKDKAVKPKMLAAAIERRASQYGLPGSSKHLVAESKKLVKIWLDNAKKHGKSLDETLTIAQEMALCHCLVVDRGYEPDDRINVDLSDEVDDDMVRHVQVDAGVLRERLANYRRFLALDAAEMYCHEDVTDDETSGDEEEDLYSSGSDMQLDEYDYSPSVISDFFPELREEVAEEEGSD